MKRLAMMLAVAGLLSGGVADALTVTNVNVGTWTRIDLPTEDVRYIEAAQGTQTLFWRDDPSSSDILRRATYAWDGTTVTLGAITSPAGFSTEVDHASILNNGGGSLEIYFQDTSIPSSSALEYANSADGGNNWANQATVSYPFPTPPGIGDSGTTGGGGLVEVGTQRRHYAQNNFGDIVLFTTTAGSSGPMTNAGRLIQKNASGTAPSGAAYSFQNQSPSGDAVVMPTGDVLYFYTDGEGAEATQGAVGVLLLDATGLGFTDVRDNFVQVSDAGLVAAGMTKLDEMTVSNVSYNANQMSFLLFLDGDSTANGGNEDIFYAPVTLTFDETVGGEPPIPEPGVMGLLGLGVLGLVRRKRRG